MQEREKWGISLTERFVLDRMVISEEEQVVFQMAGREAYRIYDRFEEEAIERLPDGDFLITLQCCLDDWVYGVILSFGPSARVIAPEYVREKILEKIRNMEKNYL